MHKNRLIPFRWLPSSWGLSGPLLLEQEARYSLDGIDLEERLAEIYFDGDDLKHRLLEIRRDYGEIDEGDYAKAKAELITDEVERNVAFILAEVKSGEMSEIDGEREIASLREEPWIRVVNDGIDPEQGIDGYFFEFDWNDLWIEALREAGYVGPTEESIVQAWFQDVCRMEASASMGAPPINGGLIVG